MDTNPTESATKKGIDLFTLDWQGLVDLINSYDPKEDVWYMISLNKGEENEYRSKFMRHREILELAIYALEKKKLRVAP